MPKATLTTNTAVDDIPHPAKGQLVLGHRVDRLLRPGRHPQKTFFLERRITAGRALSGWAGSARSRCRKPGKTPSS